MRLYEATDVKVGEINVHDTMDQLKVVQAAEDAIRTQLVPVISRLEATYDDAQTWWSTCDPLSETESFAYAAGIAMAKKDHTLYHDVDQHYKGITVDTMKAGIATMTEVLTGMNPLELSHAAGLRRQTKSGERADVTGILLLLNGVLENQTVYTSHDLEKVQLGHELVSNAELQLRTFIQDGIAQFDHMTEEETAEFMKQVHLLSNNTSDLLRHTLHFDEAGVPEDRLVELDEVRLVGLKAVIRRNAATETMHRPLYESEPELASSPEQRRAALMQLVADFQTLFDNPNSTMWRRLKNSHIKGPLHEALWYLDTAILKHVYPDRYGSLSVWPAGRNADKPTIGRPEWNRAYDYAIHKPGDTHYFQLKAASQKGKRHQKVYHPGIVTLEEENFREIQPNRLRAKLRAYKQILEADLPEGISEAVLEKYVMPTASFAMETSKIDIDSRQKQIKRILESHFLTDAALARVPHYGNRALRRTQSRKDKRKK